MVVKSFTDSTHRIDFALTFEKTNQRYSSIIFYCRETHVQPFEQFNLSYCFIRNEESIAMNNWKLEYKELILKCDKEAAKELVLSEIPAGKIIYKYFRGIKRDYDTITAPELWLCNAYCLNDPFDCAFIKGYHSVVEKYRNKEIAINKQNETFVSCFSEHSDSMVMWGIYANCHRGICVGYSLKELVEKFDCMPVIYEKTLPQYSDDTSALINTLTKYIDWEYEHEWRIVRFNKKYRMENGYKIDFVKPKEIILGLKSNDFLWRVDNTGTLSDEINPNKLIKYSENILGTNCRQYQILTSDTGYTWDKIIRI